MPNKFHKIINLDSESNTYTLKEKHLTGTALWNLKRGAIGFYDLELKHIDAVYRREAKKHVNLGRNILIEIDNKKRILIFNKK